MRKAFAMAAAAMLATLLSAQAQDYPSKPIRLVVPFPPGASTDASARILAEALGPKLGQPVVVENRAGAGGLTGMDYIAKSAPDGYTLGWPSADPMVMLPAVKKNMPYRVPEDFSYIGKFAETGFAFTIHPGVPAKTLAEFIAYAKANPGKVKYGTSGVGGSAHLGTLLFERHAGVKMVHIPYKGGAPAMTDLLGGHIDLFLGTPALVATHVTAGKVRALAITSRERSALLPDVPTVTELGLPDITYASWFGVVGPAKIPAAMQERLSKAMAEVVTENAVKDKVKAASIQLAPAFGAEFEKVVAKDLASFKTLADAEKIVVEE
jgi:tripartite-type tricarboxylate transporter receptor subunit TctC